MWISGVGINGSEVGVWINYTVAYRRSSRRDWGEDLSRGFDEVNILCVNNSYANGSRLIIFHIGQVPVNSHVYHSYRHFILTATMGY